MGSTETEATDGHEPQRRCWELNLCPLEGWQVLLTTELSVWLLQCHSTWIYFCYGKHSLEKRLCEDGMNLLLAVYNSLGGNITEIPLRSVPSVVTNVAYIKKCPWCLLIPRVTPLPLYVRGVGIFSCWWKSYQLDEQIFTPWNASPGLREEQLLPHDQRSGGLKLL